MDLKFRDLRADEIECRVNTVSENGCSLLLYKDARCDMKILDETVTPANWQRNHELINGNLFCNVSIYDEDKKEWITKQDVGTESYTEKEKGQASDSFKRACFNWGIGRELYTSPFIWIPKDKVTLQDKLSGGKKTGVTTYDKFAVTHIRIEEGIIKELSITNKTMKVMAFSTSNNIDAEKGKAEQEKKKEGLIDKATEAQIKAIKAICGKHKVPIDVLYSSNNLKEETLTKEQASNLLKSLNAKYGNK